MTCRLFLSIKDFKLTGYLCNETLDIKVTGINLSWRERVEIG